MANAGGAWDNTRKVVEVETTVFVWRWFYSMRIGPEQGQ
jgi:hypothetical protein